MAWLKRGWCALALLFALVLSSHAGLAQEDVDEERGRALAVEAMGHYKAGEYDQALAKFEEARAVYPSGQVLRMTGYTLMALGRWLEAADVLEQALDNELKPLEQKDVEHAKAQLRKVLEHVAVVTVTSTLSEATVSIDGAQPRPVPTTVRLDPGKHRFVVGAEGHRDVRMEQELGAGERTTLTLDPKPMQAVEPAEPAPPPPPDDDADEGSGGFGWFPGQGVVGLVMAGAGVVAGGVALGIGIHGLELRDAVQENIDLHNQAYDPQCSERTELCRFDIELINRDGQRAADLQNAAMVTGIVGLGLVAAGTTLFLLSDMSPLAPAGDGGDSLSLACGPLAGGVSCAGSF